MGGATRSAPLGMMVGQHGKRSAARTCHGTAHLGPRLAGDDLGLRPETGGDAAQGAAGDASGVSEQGIAEIEGGLLCLESQSDALSVGAAWM